MSSIYLLSVGVVAPGLADWPTCRDILAGLQDYQPAPIPRFNPDTLPANARRRITPAIRIAMQAATEAIRASALDAAGVATVFVTSNGDLEISDRICKALTLPERPVSPTDFHNSVHNAPAGYWSIGSHCRQPSTSLSAGAASFAAGLLESFTQVLSDRLPVMLVTYDQPPPPLLRSAHTSTVPFAAALVLTRQQDENSLARLTLAPVQQAASKGLQCSGLEAVFLGSAAARALLLLELLAGGTTTRCALPYLDARSLVVEYAPC
jgi:hypothetical protein